MKTCVCGHEMTKAEWKAQYICHRCGRTKPINEKITTADYLRSATNEEMAEWLLYNVRCTACDGEYCDELWCLNMIKQWLEEPYTEE